MKITTVNYQRGFVIGPYLQEKPGFEATLEEGDDPIECMKKLKELAQTFHQTTNPALPDQIGGEPGVTEVDKTPPEERIKALIQDMEAETHLGGDGTMGGILSWKRLVERHPELKPAFDKKLKELQG